MNTAANAAHNDATAGTHDNHVIEVAFGAHREDKNWHSVRVTIGELIKENFAEFKHGQKDGPSMTQGALAGPQRKAKAVAKNYLLMVDIDVGETMDEIAAAITARGLYAILWHTHSHGKAESEIPESKLVQFLRKDKDWARACAPSTDDVELGKQCADYFSKIKKIVPDVAATVTGVERSLTEKGMLYIVKHAPMPRVRALFVLDKPFDFSARGGTQDQALAEWTDRYSGFSVSLGLPYDPSCTDASRLMYLPRIARDADETLYKMREIKGRLLSDDDMPRLSDLQNGTAANDKGDPQSKYERLAPQGVLAGLDRASARVASGGTVPDNSKWAVKTPGLKTWLAKHANDFEIEAFLEAHGLANRGPTTTGTCFECPTDALHSDPGNTEDKGFWAESASARDGGFACSCSHATCKSAASEATGKVDRAWFLDEFCAEHGLGVDDLLAHCPAYVRGEDARVVLPELPPGFMYGENGDIHTRDQDGDDTGRLCAPLSIVCRAQDEKSSDWSKVFAFTDGAGVEKEIVVRDAELHGDEKALVAKFANEGLSVETGSTPRTAFVRLLNRMCSDNKRVVVSQPGWQTNGVFVPPCGDVVKPEGVAHDVEYIWTMRPPRFDAVPRGTFEAWCGAASELVSMKSPQIGIGVLLGAIGPIIHCAPKYSPRGVFWAGPSSSGKSSGGECQVSLWSNTDEDRGLFITARATTNMLELHFAMANGTTLCIDDLQNGGEKLAQDFVYMAAAGAGKARMRADATARKVQSWGDMSFSSTAEFTQSQLLELQYKSKEAAGANARCLTLDSVHAVMFETAKEYDDLMGAIRANFGWAGPQFVVWLQSKGWHQAGNAHGVVEEMVDDALGKLAEGLPSAQRRGCEGLALMLVAGHLMQDAGVLGKSADVDGVVNWALQTFKASEEFAKLAPEKNAAVALLEWCETTGDLYPFGMEALPGRIVKGWYDAEGTVYLPKSTLRDIPDMGSTPEAAITELKRSGRLDKNGDKWTWQKVPRGSDQRGKAGTFEMRHYRILKARGGYDAAAMDAAVQLGKDVGTGGKRPVG